MDELTVDFCGEITELSPGEELTFGRAADLEIDSNPYLHRVVGRLVHLNDLWWVENLGSSIVLSLVDLHSRSHARITPGNGASITFPSSVIRFTAHQSTYEIDLRLPDAPEVDESPAAADDTTPPPGAAATMSVANVTLTDKQLRLVLALAEESLRNPTRTRMVLPTNREVAERLGWKITTYNRALDYLSTKLERLGVTGLHGGGGDIAADRRERIVDWALDNRLVSESDLELLDKADTGDDTGDNDA